MEFSKEVIKSISERMHEYGFSKYFTVAHELQAGETVKFLESWIKETDEDKSNAFGINEPIGTLFMKVKIESDLIWSNIKDGKLNGFSVELDASMIETKMNKMDFTKILKNEFLLEDSKLIFNSLDVGEVVVEVELDGNSEPEFFNGEFSVENKKYTVEDGNIISMEEVENNEEQAEEENTEDAQEFNSDLVTELNESIKSLTEKIANLFEKVEELSNKEVESKPNDDLVEKFEELKLELKQRFAKEEEESETIRVEDDKNFNIDSYRAASNWAKIKK